MADLFLIRHTKVNNPKNLCYGHSEIDLCDSFEEEKDALIKKIGFDFFNIVYTSPLKRALNLAEGLKCNHLIIDDSLKELNFGTWEQTAWNAIPEEELNPWMADFVNIKAGYGEAYTELFKRATNFWETIKAQPSHQIAIITHAGVIRSILSYLLSIPLNKSFDLQIDYGSVTKIVQKNNRHSISFINR